MVYQSGKDWDYWIPSILLNYRKISPLKALYGIEPRNDVLSEESLEEDFASISPREGKRIKSRFNAEDWVYVVRPHRKDKLAPKNTGPFVIERVGYNNAYSIKTTNVNSVPGWIIGRRLIPYQAESSRGGLEMQD